MAWAPGSVVVLRELWLGRVFTARPWIVVRDEPDELVLFIPAGAPTKVPPAPKIPRDEWSLEDGVWRLDALRVARPGEAHSILLWWENGRRADQWYVNVERPFRRSRVGFDYLDLELDLVCFADGSWRLEDEDELAEAQRRGVVSFEEAAEVRAEARRVVAEWPFPTGWESFAPDPAWPTPELPDGWDVV